jgi:hypothetical protein
MCSIFPTDSFLVIKLLIIDYQLLTCEYGKVYATSHSVTVTAVATDRHCNTHTSKYMNCFCKLFIEDYNLE